MANQGFYPYQERVHETLINQRKNVILQAPTGAGKTRAALYPYLQNLDRYCEEAYPLDAPLPLTCRYAVPMRVLATQFLREYHASFEKMDRRRGTRLMDRYSAKLGVGVPAIQTGENPEDTRFESPLTFCTIDQLLASFIGTPYSLGPGQANLNVGAVIGSYLILDEFHLYPLDGSSSGARMTTLAMLRLLNQFKGTSTQFAPFTLMTATFSTQLLTELGDLLGAVVVRVEDSELPEIMKGRARVVRCADEPMSPEAVLSAHDVARARGAGASLVVCNTVARAQEMYVHLRDELIRRGRRDEFRLELLHSRFTSDDRKRKSDDLERWLGKDQWDADGHYLGQNTIVVGTQVVEVGLNISSGALHTELAPASSIIQRAGRCARFDSQLGEVVVYPIPVGENGKMSYRPYDEKTCHATWEALDSLSSEAQAPAGVTGRPFGFSEEQRLIDAVHTEEDKRFLATFQTSEGQTGRTIMETLASHDRGKTSELIRDVQSVSVLVHPTPNEDITVKPFTWESFSLHPYSVVGVRDALDQRAQELGLDWTMKQLQPAGDAQNEPDNDRESVYTWAPVSKPQIPSALRLVVPPELAAYDRELGFRFLRPGDPEVPEGRMWKSRQIENKKKQEWTLRAQRSYVEHISGLASAYEWSVHRELAWIGSRLETAFNLPAGSLDEAIRLAIACHDIGKLSVGWQRWAHATQAELVKRYGSVYAPQPGRALLAKTDGRNRWQEEKDVQDTLKARSIRRPPHACAGVIASAILIGKRMMDRAGTQNQAGALALTKAALSAIARHHAPTATTYDAVDYDAPAACQALVDAFTACRLPTVDLASLDLSSKPKGEVGSQMLVSPSDATIVDVNATWLGFVLVRALRLCDQRAERDWV